jgi:hypothetical protein
MYASDRETHIEMFSVFNAAKCMVYTVMLQSALIVSFVLLNVYVELQKKPVCG